MSEQEVKMQGAGVERLSPGVVLMTGLIVWLIGMVGSLTSQFWVEHYGLSWSSTSIMVIVVLGTGLVWTLYGWHVWWEPTEDKPGPLSGIERELAGLRQEVAALRVRLEDGA